MQPQQFELLGERLLRSGIAPRHVRRYLRELRDHYDDAVQGELRKGAGRAAAEESASKRLGEPDHLLESALARPELLSWSRRWPWAVYIVAPLLLFPAAFVATILAMVGLMQIVMPGTEVPFPTPLLEILKAIRLLNLYVLPVIAASVFCAAGQAPRSFARLGLGVDHTHYLRRRSAKSRRLRSSDWGGYRLLYAPRLPGGNVSAALVTHGGSSRDAVHGGRTCRTSNANGLIGAQLEKQTAACEPTKI